MSTTNNKNILSIINVTWQFVIENLTGGVLFYKRSYENIHIYYRCPVFTMSNVMSDNKKIKYSTIIKTHVLIDIRSFIIRYTFMLLITDNNIFQL